MNKETISQIKARLQTPVRRNIGILSIQKLWNFANYATPRRKPNNPNKMIKNCAITPHLTKNLSNGGGL